MWARIWPTSSPCWSVRNRPASASRSAGSLARSRPLANAASTSGSWVPATRAFSIARPETPMMSVATLDSLIPASSQDLVQPLDLPGAFLDLGLAVAGQLAQLPDRAGRHEAGPDQPVLDQLGDPGRVGHIGLPPRDVVQVGRVQQPALHLVLE